MKRSELKVGMVVENKRGNTFRVVSIAGWRNWGGYRADATGLEYDGIPIVSRASMVKADGRRGVLVVGEHWIVGIKNGDKMAGTQLSGEVMMPQHMYPAGHYNEAIKARKAAMEARVDEDAKRDAELVEQVNLYWGDVPHLIATCGVTVDDGLLTEKERQVLVTMILCGQNR